MDLNQSINKILVWWMDFIIDGYGSHRLYCATPNQTHSKEYILIMAIK